MVRFTDLGRCLVLVVLVLVARPAWAHPAPFSYLDLDLRDDRIAGALVIHIFDVAHDLDVSPPERLLDPAFLASRQAALEALVSQRLNIRTDRLLTPQWERVQAPADQQAVRPR